MADRNADSTLPEPLEQASERRSHPWPEIQKNAIRNATIGIAMIAVVIWIMYRLSLGNELNTGRFYVAFAVSSLVFSALFSLLGGSVVEDGVKSVVILITGSLLVVQFPLPWCLVPGASAVVASIVNGTIQATLGRYF